MSSTERFTGRRYDIVAFAYGEKTVYYEEFHDDWASENGEWLLVGQGLDGFSVYHGEFGYRCCKRCKWDLDPFGLEFDPHFRGFNAQRTRVTRKRAAAFVQRYNLQPVIALPEAAMRHRCEARTLVDVLPARFGNVDGPAGKTSP